MKVYIYEDVSELTPNYHSEGGLVIITDRNPLDAYNENAEHEGGITLEELPAPDSTIEASSAKEKVYIFPDAGCC